MLAEDCIRHWIDVNANIGFSLLQLKVALRANEALDERCGGGVGVVPGAGRFGC
jgi:hypothetical protein